MVILITLYMQLISYYVSRFGELMSLSRLNKYKTAVYYSLILEILGSPVSWLIL